MGNQDDSVFKGPKSRENKHKSFLFSVVPRGSTHRYGVSETHNIWIKKRAWSFETVRWVNSLEGKFKNHLQILEIYASIQKFPKIVKVTFCVTHISLTHNLYFLMHVCKSGIHRNMNVILAFVIVFSFFFTYIFNNVFQFDMSNSFPFICRRIKG